MALTDRSKIALNNACGDLSVGAEIQTKMTDLTGTNTFTGANTYTGTNTFNNTLTIGDSSDTTKQIVFSASGSTAGKITTIAAASTLNRTVTLPNATDTLVGLATTDTLTNKTLTDPIVTNVTRCTLQLDKTDATLTNITGLQQTVVAGTYRFRYVLPVTCGGTGGTKTAFKYTTTALSAINYSSLGFTATAVAVANGTTTTDQATQD